MSRCAVACLLVFAACGVEPTEVRVATAEQDALASVPIDAVPAPGDYDGDGCTDIGLKSSSGIWYIDYCANGFGGAWDAAYFNYGDSTAVPVPADYDGDGYTDLAVKDASGMWAIDYAWNGFGVWDVEVFGYGDASAVPVPADYDGDGMADLSVKDATGMWGIDYAAGGFGGWNWQNWGYGDSTWVPVPADYDGDGHCSVTTTTACSLTAQCPGGEKCVGMKADLAIKTSAGDWYLDYSADGFGGRLCRLCSWGLWNRHLTGYGDATAVPVPADYDHDGHADLAVKNAANYGTWLIDYWSTGFGAWDPPTSGYSGRGASWSIAVPGNYTNDGDARLDLAVKDNNSGYWYIDNVANGFTTWDTSIDNVHRPNVQIPTGPSINSTTIIGPGGQAATFANGQYQLTIGVRYTVVVNINPGNGQYTAGVEINPALHVPTALHLDKFGTIGRIDGWTNRRFALECSQPGSFPLGFEMRDAGAPTGTGIAFNPDPGILVNCTGATGLLWGRVTQRTCTPPAVTSSCPAPSQGVRDCVFGSGAAIGNATVTITGMAPFAADANGYWSATPPTNVPLTVTITAPSFSPTTAVNVVVPAGAGLELDTPLEEPFTTLRNNGIQYTTYIDYSRGRTILHTIRIDTAFARVRTEKPAAAIAGPPPSFNTLLQIANSIGSGTAGALAIVNGSYFDEPGGTSIPCPCSSGYTCDTNTNTCHYTGTGKPVGYFYSADYGGYVPSLRPQTDTPTSYAQGTTYAANALVTTPWPRFQTGSAVVVDYAELPGNSNDWIAIAPVGSALSTYTTRIYTVGKKSGQASFASIPDGTYVARAFIANTTTLAGQSASFVVGRSGGTAKLVVNPSFLPSENVYVNYSGLTLDSTDWITVATPGSDLSTYVAKLYTDGSGSGLCSNPAGAGTMCFWSVAPGTYEIRAFNHDGTLAASTATFTVANAFEASQTAPLLAIKGTGYNQNVSIVPGTPNDYYSGFPWNTEPYPSFAPIYDVSPRDLTSDIQFGFQCWPSLLVNGAAIERARPGNDEIAWARTAAGVAGRYVYLVVADGEGVMGGNGASFNQLGEFFRDVLGCTDALNFDGGWSSEMVLWGAYGPRRLNAITGEDNTVDIDPYRCSIVEGTGTFGSVANYVKAGL